MKKAHTTLIDYLHTLFPTWLQDIPTFMDFVEDMHLAAHERLLSQRGDIYFLSQGGMGQYIKGIPQRYVLACELIIVPLAGVPAHFRALEDTCMLFLKRASLYQLAQDYPITIQLYDQLLAEQERANAFRMGLLALPKVERLAAFRARFAPVIPLITRMELAQYLGVSREYLRRIF